MLKRPPERVSFRGREEIFNLYFNQVGKINNLFSVAEKRLLIFPT